MVLCSLIKQICRTSHDIPNGFLKIKRDALPPSQLGNVDSFVEAVRHAQLREVFLIHDALDECARHQRPAIFSFLSQLDRPDLLETVCDESSRNRHSRSVFD